MTAFSGEPPYLVPETPAHGESRDVSVCEPDSGGPVHPVIVAHRKHPPTRRLDASLFKKRGEEREREPESKR